MPLLLVPLLIVLASSRWFRLRWCSGIGWGPRASVREAGSRRSMSSALRFSAAILLASAALASVWVPGALKYTAGGLAGGCVLGMAGLWLTRWEHGPGRLHYTPNRWLVLGITLLVTGANPVRLLACVAHVGCDCRRPRLVCDDRSGGLDGRGRGCAWILPGVLDWRPQPDQAAFGTADAMITAERPVRRAAAQWMISFFELIDHVEVRNVEIPYRAERRFKRLVPVLPFAGAEMAADLPQRPQHPRPVETLPFTMLTVVHDPLSISH